MSSFEYGDFPDPVLKATPTTPFGLRLRVELKDTEPAVWRSIEVPGNIHLDTVHALLQGAMGWWDSHLHQFRQGHDREGAVFLTDFDVTEGAEGIREEDTRLDQLLTEVGDELDYVYDYGDNWEHLISVEEVLPVPPALPGCISGGQACPPEDVGGVSMYGQVAAWVRAGLPDVPGELSFEPELIREWLDPGWHPDSFSVDDATRAMQESWVHHIRVDAELSQLLAGLTMFAGEMAAELLGNKAWRLHSPGDCLVTPEMLAPFTTFLDVIGEGVKLNAAKNLPRAVVQQYAVASGIADWWPRALTSEANVAPVAEVHEVARALGLVYLRNGRLLPTKAAQELGENPVSWMDYLSRKLPLGKTKFDRHAGWVTLLVAGADIEFDVWDEDIGTTLADLGWQTILQGRTFTPNPDNPTLAVLEILVRGTDRAYLAEPEIAPSEESLERNRRAAASLARQAVLLPAQK